MSILDRLACGVLIGLAAGGALAAKGYHLWYDENGQAVYSQIPPDDGRETRLVKPPPPPAESPEVARQRLQQQLQQFEDNREDEELAADKAAKAEAEAQVARERCAAARHNLEGLNGPARRLFHTPDGQYQRLSEEEREKRRAELQKVIAEDCR